MFREVQGPAGGLLKAIPLDGGRALRKPMACRQGLCASALPEAENAKRQRPAANMAAS